MQAQTESLQLRYGRRGGGEVMGRSSGKPRRKGVFGKRKQKINRHLSIMIKLSKDYFGGHPEFENMFEGKIYFQNVIGCFGCVLCYKWLFRVSLRVLNSMHNSIYMNMFQIQFSLLVEVCRF